MPIPLASQLAYSRHIPHSLRFPRLFPRPLPSSQSLQAVLEMPEHHILAQLAYRMR